MNRRFTVALCVALTALVPAFAAALGQMGARPKTVSGGFVSEVVDRVNIRVDGTDFVFAEKSDGGYEFCFTLTLSKTEADFFARLDAVTLSGVDYDSMVFESLGDTPDGAVAEGLVLGARDGSPTEYSWLVTVSAPSLPEKATLSLRVTSGMTRLTSETRERDVELSFTV